MAQRGHTQPLRARIRTVLAANPPAARLIHETLFAKALPWVRIRAVRRSGEPGADGLARAVEAITGRGIPSDEADWMERIERYRDQFAARGEPIRIKRAMGESAEYRPLHFARVSSIHRPWGAFLMRLARELRPRSCVELGTAIGISAAYQGAALDLNGEGRLRTVEGSPQLAELARETLDAMQISRVEVIEGRFDDVLDGVLAEAAPVDLAYLDAGKAREHNLRQFERLLPHLAPGAALVMDDIHWSREMKGAWREIRAHERVALSVDLWRLGACFIRTDSPSARMG